MNHIELALSILNEEISKLNKDLKYGHNLPHQEEEIVGRLQQLNRAVSDINKRFLA